MKETPLFPFPPGLEYISTSFLFNDKENSYYLTHVNEISWVIDRICKNGVNYHPLISYGSVIHSLKPERYEYTSHKESYDNAISIAQKYMNLI